MSWPLVTREDGHYQINTLINRKGAGQPSPRGRVTELKMVEFEWTVITMIGEKLTSGAESARLLKLPGASEAHDPSSVASGSITPLCKLGASAVTDARGVP